MHTIRVVVTGLGGVGLLLAETLVARRAEYRARLDIDVVLTGVCARGGGLIDADGLDTLALRDRAGFDSALTGESFLRAVTADLLFESGPSDYDDGGPGLGYLRGALERGMDAVAVSKGALVVDGPALRALAATHGRELRASAAGAAGLPVIDFLRYDLAGSEITRMEAILTGTTAFVLDHMTRERVEWDTALAEAQLRGIAEPDPSFDIDGWDTAAKTVIIADSVFGTALNVHRLPREGIREVTLARLDAWREEGLRPALVGAITRTSVGVEASVALRTFALGHPFSALAGSAKGLAVRTREYGEHVLVGGGSSREATVAAALKDLEHILCAR